MDILVHVFLWTCFSISWVNISVRSPRHYLKRFSCLALGGGDRTAQNSRRLCSLLCAPFPPFLPFLPPVLLTTFFDPLPTFYSVWIFKFSFFRPSLGPAFLVWLLPELIPCVQPTEKPGALASFGLSLAWRLQSSGTPIFQAAGYSSGICKTLVLSVSCCYGGLCSESLGRF